MVVTWPWHGVATVQAVPPPLTLAVFTRGDTASLAICTGALMTRAFEPGSKTSLVVQVSSAAVEAVQSQPTPLPLATTGVTSVMPVGIASLTTIWPLVLLVPMLLTKIEYVPV